MAILSDADLRAASGPTGCDATLDDWELIPLTVARPKTSMNASLTGAIFDSLSDATTIFTSPPESVDNWKYGYELVIVSNGHDTNRGTLSSLDQVL